MIRYGVVAAVVVGWAEPAAAQSGRAAIAVTDVSVLDVRTGSASSGITVIVTGNHIMAVGPARSVSIPAGARQVDGSGKYLIPGLWDMHVHATFPGLDAIFLQALVANGVTGVREMFSTLAAVDSSRSRIRRGELAGPRIVGSGNLVDGSPPIWPGSVVVTNADLARRAVDSLAAGGADFIKVYSRLSREAYFAIAEAARVRGIPFAGHVPALVRVSEAAAAGQRSIEHLTGVLSACSSREEELLGSVAEAVRSPRGWDSAGTVGRMQTEGLLASFDPARCEALGRELAGRGVWMVPTLVVLHSIAHLDDTTLRSDPRLRYVPAGFRSGWDPSRDFRFRSRTARDWAVAKEAYARQLEIVTLLHRAGVRFLAGTDLANPFVYPGFSLHDELVGLVELGFTPLQALQSATLHPAEFLGVADSVGRVAPGMVADLVLLDGHPLADVRNVGKIAAVIADGRLIDRSARDALLARVEALAR
jgi:imidazolonepropionase-like amidohydrolase